MDKTCLSYWFPKLNYAGIPTPLTSIVDKAPDNLFLLCEGRKPKGWNEFLLALEDACDSIANKSGYPLFLRTGQTSGKHNWNRTCCLKSKADLSAHVSSLVEFSEFADFIGLAKDVWVVREMLPVEQVAILDRYGDFPLVKEMRGFVEGGEIKCAHPYWPAGAIKQGFRNPPENVEELEKMAEIGIDKADEAHDLLKRVAGAFNGDGAWSVDILQTKNGLFVTDMAEAGKSYHWAECQNKFIREKGW